MSHNIQQNKQERLQLPKLRKLTYRKKHFSMGVKGKHLEMLSESYSFRDPPDQIAGQAISFTTETNWLS